MNTSATSTMSSACFTSIATAECSAPVECGFHLGLDRDGALYDLDGLNGDGEYEFCSKDYGGDMSDLPAKSRVKTHANRKPMKACTADALDSVVMLPVKCEVDGNCASDPRSHSELVYLGHMERETTSVPNAARPIV